MIHSFYFSIKTSYQISAAMIAALIISALIEFCICHTNDQECFPHAVQLQSSADSEITIDITHTYINDFGSETVKSKEQISLDSGESTTVNLYAAGYTKFNPREIHVRNSNGRIEAAMASMSYFYNSVLGESTTDWECWNSSQ